jgi:hypothetical protein
MNNLAATYYAVGKLTMALPLWEEYFRLSKAKQGSDHPSTLNAMNNLAQGYVAAGKRDQALRLQEECLRLQKAKRGPDHPDSLKAMGNLAQGYAAAGKHDQALAMQEECLRRRKATLGPDHPDTLLSMNNLAASHFAANKLDQAIPLYEGAAKKLAKRGFEHEQAGLIMSNTATAFEAANDLDTAERWRRQWAGVVKERSGAASIAYAGELASLGDNLLRQRKYVDAEGVLRECFAIRDKTQPKVWSTFNTQSTLGAALLGQKKYADAEPLLLRGYDEMKQREATIPPKAKTQRLCQAVDRLIELYTVTNRADEIKKWKAERAKLAPQPPAKQEGKKKPQEAAAAG